MKILVRENSQSRHIAPPSHPLSPSPRPELPLPFRPFARPECDILRLMYSSVATSLHGLRPDTTVQIDFFLSTVTTFVFKPTDILLLLHYKIGCLGCLLPPVVMETKQNGRQTTCKSFKFVSNIMHIQLV